jgi:DNA polymerase elongation subunit (family B)
METSKKEIVKREVRFAVHLPKSNKYSESIDMHYVKEQITYSDGSKAPNTYLLRNFLRPFWVTKPVMRNYTEKKEFELTENLIKYDCTQSELTSLAAKAINQPHLINNPREIKNSPYLYGYDVTSTSYIKLLNLLKHKSIQSAYSISVFDIETDLDTEDVILATIAMEGKAYTAILKSFVSRSVDIENRIRKALALYLPNYSNLDYTFEVFDNEVKLLYHVFQKAVEYAPDLMAIWNIDYDIPFVLKRLENHKVDPRDILCDQSLPKPHRLCYYKQGIKKKMTSSGVVKPIPPSLQWHTLFLTSPFYVIDAMCVYRQLRIAQQEEPSYSLDNILQKELGTRKLSFEQADKYSGKAWHIFMQKNYPIEYIIYNLWDCLSVLELDKKTKDLAYALPSFAGMTDFAKFNSNPKKIVDALFPFGLERGKVIGTVGKVEEREEEKEVDDSIDLANDDDPDTYELEDDALSDVRNYRTLGLKDWIQTLTQGLLVHEGLKVVGENPAMVTNLRGCVVDADVSSSYPSCTLVSNVSKETTENELVSIDGIKEKVFREQNLGLIAGSVNAIEYCSRMLNLPSLDEIDTLIQ